MPGTDQNQSISLQRWIKKVGNIHWMNLSPVISFCVVLVCTQTNDLCEGELTCLVCLLKLEKIKQLTKVNHVCARLAHVN